MLIVGHWKWYLYTTVQERNVYSPDMDIQITFIDDMIEIRVINFKVSDHKTWMSFFNDNVRIPKNNTGWHKKFF